MANVNEIPGNTSSALAQKLSIGDSLTGALTVKGGYEYYALQISGPCVLEITFSVNQTLTNYAYGLSIANAQNQKISGTILGYGLTSSTFDTYLPSSGTYYLYATNNNLFLTDPYTFTTSYNNSLLGAIEKKPSNTVKLATPITLGVTYTGQTSSTNDPGYYAFTVGQSGSYALSFDSPTTALVSANNVELKSANYLITLQDASGKILQSYTTFFQNTSPTLFANLGPGSYVLLINGASGYDGDNYAFAVNAAPLASSPTLRVGDKITASLQPGSTFKSYAINLVAGNFYQFTCNANPSGAQGGLMGEKLSLTDLNGNELENNLNTPVVNQNGSTESTINQEPSIELIAPYTGTYYLSVDSPSHTGSFTLSTTLNSKNDLIQDILKKATSVTPNAIWKTTPGQTLNLTYAFMSSNPLTSQTGFAAMTSDQQAMVQKALQTVSSLVNITFTLTTDEKNANILYGTSTQSGSSGVTVNAKLNSDGSYKQNAVYLNNTGTTLTTLLTSGGFGYQTLIHETGHALGLKHPGEYNASATATTDLSKSAPFAPAGWDNTEYTLMSYVTNQYALGTAKSSYSSIDIAALQSLYGAPGNLSVSTFTVPANSALTTTAPIGALGSTIDLSNQTVSSTLALGEGTLSSIGVDSRGLPAHDNITLPWGSRYSNVITSAVGDVVYCNTLNDTVTLSGGNNTVISSGGLDTVVLNQSSKFMSFTNNNGAITASDSSGRLGSNLLIHVSRVKMADLGLAYDLSGNAGQVAKILGAVFGPSAVNNPSYVGLGLNYLDNGMTYAQLSALALSAAGANTPSKIVNVLYTNVVGSAPTTAQAAPYLQMLQTGTSPGDLAVLAEDTALNASRINLVGLSSTGIQYTS
jgi:serralysin